MGNNTIDKITRLLDKAINFLFVYNPLNTALGLIFGGILMGMKDFFAKYFSPIGEVSWYAFILFGVLIFDIPCLIFGIKTSPETERKIKELNEIQKSGNFSPEEIRSQWRLLVSDVIERDTPHEKLENPETHKINA
ncbi:MAG: hypothetical protein J1F01_07430 [Oscillospiraceae bacterium]|nr:hypothetical protein [Oscillospiraceae bacterium]